MPNEKNIDDEGISGSGQTGGDRRWEQVAARVEGKQEAEGVQAVHGEAPASGQSIRGAEPGESDKQDESE